MTSIIKKAANFKLLRQLRNAPEKKRRKERIVPALTTSLRKREKVVNTYQITATTPVGAGEPWCSLIFLLPAQLSQGLAGGFSLSAPLPSPGRQCRALGAGNLSSSEGCPAPPRASSLIPPSA